MKKKLIIIIINITILCSVISAKTLIIKPYYDKNNWEDVGQVVDENYFVSNLISYNNDLYATHENKTFKYEGDTDWSFAGEIEVHNIRVLTIYNQSFYAGTDFGSIHRYNADNLSWEYCGIAGFNCNHIHSFAVYHDLLYAGTYTGNVYRYDGSTIWTYVGNPGNSIIELWVEELIVYQDELYAAKIAGFPPEGARVYRYEGDTNWSYVGEPGNRENPHINDLIVYNDILYAGNYDNTVSMYEGNTSWKIIDELTDGAVNSFQLCKNKIYFGTSDHFHKQTHFYCYDGENPWVDLGMPINGTGSLTALASHKNSIYGTGPVDFKGHVYRYNLVNDPPTKPTIAGPTNGKPDIEYEFIFNSTDPNDDSIMYLIEWGDDTTEWTEYGDSGEEFTLKHIWNKEGNYIIKAKAIDIDNAESNWSEFKLNIPRNKAISIGGFVDILGGMKKAMIEAKSRCPIWLPIVASIVLVFIIILIVVIF